jgi:kumamolisin
VKKGLFMMVTLLVILVVAVSGFAQSPASSVKGKTIAPPSSRLQGPWKVRTPLLIFIPDGNVSPDIPNGETPASIACIYGVTVPTSGCPKNGTLLSTGGAKAIAVVEFGHNTTLQSDMNTFTSQFGLPAITLTEICSPGPPPCPTNNGSGWDVETALDVQWAHAMAPNARIIVSEFTDDPFTDGAESAAGAAVAAAGGGEVSNSFGYGGEFDGELQNDLDMQTPTVVYFASAGDSGLGADYPSVSPYVVSAGGTHINRDSNGNFEGTESCWDGSGGGLSSMEPVPTYQFIISNLVGPKRGTPDLAADADPATGVDVYSTTGCGGWCQVGGTSVSSPVLAGIVNAAGDFKNSTHAELTKTYLEYQNPLQWRTNFFDVVTGNNGAPAKFGWDQCTGIGSPRKLAGL